MAYTLDPTEFPGFISLHHGFEGDADDDGSVTFADFIALANNFGMTGTGWDGGDFNGDGLTNFTDFVALANNFGQTVGETNLVVSAQELAAFTAAAESFGWSPTSVPEPSSLLLLAAAPTLLSLRRRRRLGSRANQPRL
jgi:hypothetical protein